MTPLAVAGLLLPVLAAAALWGLAGRGQRGLALVVVALALAAAAVHGLESGAGAILSGLLLGSAYVAVTAADHDLQRRARWTGAAAGALLALAPVALPSATSALAQVGAAMSTLLVGATWATLLPWLGAELSIVALGALTLWLPQGGALLAPVVHATAAWPHPLAASVVLALSGDQVPAVPSWLPQIHLACAAIATALLLATPWLPQVGNRARIRLGGGVAVLGIVPLALTLAMARDPQKLLPWGAVASLVAASPVDVDRAGLAWSAFRFVAAGLLVIAASRPATGPATGPAALADHRPPAFAVVVAAALALAWSAWVPAWVGPLWPTDPAAFALAAVALASAGVRAAGPSAASATTAAIVAWYAAVTLAGGAAAAVRVAGVL